MKPTETEIENLLRAAPQPRPPAGLKDRLLRQLPHPAMNPTPKTTQNDRPAPEPHPAGKQRTLPGWLLNGWPALAAACFALAGLMALATQRTELNKLRRQVEELKREQTALPPASSRSTTGASAGASGVVVPHAREDLERLRGLEQQLAGEVTALEALRAENEQLRAQALTQSGLSPEEVQPLLDARTRARSIVCVNQLKQLGLAARIWATDHGDVLPPDFSTMSNEIVTPKVLVCPEDTGRQAAADWTVFTPAQVSYEFLAPGGSETEPQRVMFRCPIHGHVCLMDGSVHSGVAREHPERLVLPDGKLYYNDPRPSAPARPGATSPVQGGSEINEGAGLRPDASSGSDTPALPTASEVLLRRYGLLPPDDPGAPKGGESEPEPAP